MEYAALWALTLFLPILAVLPAWQRMRRDAKGAQVLATDLRILIQGGERERALSVIEQGSPRLALSLRDAILRPAPATSAQQREIRMPTLDLATQIFCVVGLLAILAGLTLFLVAPELCALVLYGLSMYKAGTMLQDARQELNRAHRMLLLTVREAA